MKKLFLILIMTATVATAWAQSQLSTVRGKTKDGKTIKVDYYKGTVEDVIQSVKYQLVDELQADKKDLQSRANTLQTKLDAANKQVKELQKRLEDCGDVNEIKRLKTQLAEKENTITGLRKDIATLNKQLEDCVPVSDDDLDLAELREQIAQKQDTISLLSKQVIKLNKDKERLQNQLDACVDQSNCDELQIQLKEKNAQIAKNERIIDSLMNVRPVKPVTTDNKIKKLQAEIKEKEKAIDNLNRELADCKRGVTKPVKTPVIGLEFGFGPAFPGSSVAEPWAKEVKSCLQADVYFGTARLSESFPVSVEAGLGFRKFGMAARLNEYNTILNTVDADGDSYQAIYAFEPARGINFAAFLQSRLHGAIYKAFKNTCSYSRHTAHPTLPDGDDHFAYFDNLENHHPSPERQLLAREKLQNIVKELTAAEKELLHLIYVRELPQKAAAQLLNITPQAVSKRKRNLITKIKKLA